MTESGEKWAGEKVLQCAGIFGYPIHSLEKTAEFWLRAFCEEVGKRAELKASVGSNSPFLFTTEAFEELKRELLGET